jgi:hypothetical protein
VTPRAAWSIELPVRLASAANAHLHRMARHRVTKRLRGTAKAATVEMPSIPDGGGLAVTLTRIAPRALDGHDNLRAAFKPIVDGLADRLGVKDNDPRVSWHYAQERRGVRDYAITIRVEPTTP